MQNYSNSIANALELLQSCTKQSKWPWWWVFACTYSLFHIMAWACLASIHHPTQHWLFVNITSWNKLQWNLNQIQKLLQENCQNSPANRWLFCAGHNMCDPLRSSQLFFQNGIYFFNTWHRFQVHVLSRNLHRKFVDFSSWHSKKKSDSVIR